MEAQCSPRSQLGPPYSPHALTKARCRDSTNGALKAHTKPLQSRMGLLHNKPETPTNTTKLHHNGMWLRGHNKLSRTPSPKSNKLKSANALKRNYLLNFTYHYNESSERTQTDAPNAMARAHEVLKSLTLKSHQSNKSYGGI